MIWKYCLFSIMGLLSTLLAIVLSPLLSAYSVLVGVDVLPGFLQLLSTPDDTLDGEQHQNHQPVPSTKLGLWWERTCWICRNPALGVHAKLLGVPETGTKIIASSSTGDHDGVSFSSHIVFSVNSNRYFEYQAHFPLGESHYFGIWLGWKLVCPSNLPYHVWKLSVSPFRTVS